MPRRIPYLKPSASAPARQAARRQYERQPGRRADIAFYQSDPWRRLRALKLVNNPLCEPCERAGRLVEAKHVHHVLERKDRPDLELEYSNLESACVSCHSKYHGFKKD